MARPRGVRTFRDYASRFVWNPLAPTETRNDHTGETGKEPDAPAEPVSRAGKMRAAR